MSGNVLAGFETLAQILDNFIEGRRGRWNDNFTREQISHFLSSVTSGLLHSFGQDFPGKKNYSKYKKREADLYTKCRGWGLFDNCNFIADSGGFQISIGRLTRKESDLLYNMYYEWLEEYHDVYDKAFILDIPPGPGCEIFHNFEDVYKLNLESYKRAQKLPDHIRKKIIYVHHFRTPALWDIYTRILREEDMFNSFEYHGTGGIVANMASDMSIPCIIYILPLIPLINEAKRNNRNYLNFHILGGANFRDVFFYELFKQVIKDKHNIDLNITYDSSGLYKQVMVGRFIYVKDDTGSIKKMNIKSDNLRCNLNSRMRCTVRDLMQVGFNDVADKWNFKRISIDDVYDTSRDTFYEDVKVYLMLYTLDFYAQVQYDMKDAAKELYTLYSNGYLQEFNIQCANITRSLNQGKLTKKQIAKSAIVTRSLDILSSLDENYCKNVITKFLSKDEFINLIEDKKVLLP